MTFDGPAQQAIHEFLAAHRLQPGRTTRERLLGRSPLSGRSAQWYWTAVGQLGVSAKLERMRPEWSVVHGLPTPPASDSPDPIDHLLVGPAGVFAVNTYNHARQNVLVSRRSFTVDGHRLQYIRRAEAAIGHVERTLESAAGRRVRASSIIVVIDPGSLQVRDLPRDVFVVAAASLVTWLKSQDHVLDAATVAELTAVAVLETTWASAPESPDALAAARERTEFEHIRHLVASARVVRAAWAIGIVALVTGMLVAVGILQLLAAQP